MMGIKRTAWSALFKLLILTVVLASLNTAFHLSAAADLMIAAVAIVWHVDGYLVGRR